MDKEQLVAEIEQLQEQAQARLNQLAQGDSVWSNLQGQIGALNRVVGSMEDEKEEKAPVKKG